MGKEKLDAMDFMSFISSMSKMDEIKKPKNKKKVKCVIEEAENENEDVAVNKDLDEEGVEKKDSNNDSDVNSDDITVSESGSEDDEDDMCYQSDISEVLSNYFSDEYGVNVATSMSNIAFELHQLNKNISKLLKDKEKK